MSDKPMMKCGHRANAVDAETGKPSCAIHAGLTSDALVVADEQPDLSGRTARCTCGKTVPSDSEHIAFFEHRPDEEFDGYYCGHGGWD